MQCGEMLLIFLMIVLAACSPAVHTATSSPPSRLPTVAPPITSSEPGIASSPQANNEQRLAEFWHKRTRTSRLADYPLGAGDVLMISVPGMEEITNREVRISGAGTVALPLVGTLEAQGRTEEELRAEIQRRLSDNYMHNPQVNVFVREYRSRQVAVIGAVAKPGLYRLASESDTLLDMLSLAGGLTKEAAQRIHFIPAEPMRYGEAQQIVSALPTQLMSQTSSPLLLKRADSLMIDLHTLSKGANQLYLAMPVRPGDVLLVPGGGEVFVEGWVQKPGSYKINAGLTVLGAVAAAGGPMFAADTGAVRVVRTEADGKKEFFLVSLQAVKQGTQQDLVVVEGDIVEVTASTARVVPYGVYQFFTSVFRVGGSLPLTGF